MDKFKDVKQLRKTKKRLKNRFWTEIYDGAKLFYLSGLLHGKYGLYLCSYVVDCIDGLILRYFNKITM